MSDEVNEIIEMTMTTLINVYEGQIEDDVLEKLNMAARLAVGFTTVMMNEKIESIITKHWDD